ncbi:fatty acid desaturase family protein [Streptomyces sp. 8L]|uniref:fatty acid desaturase family protein n=1 Tax=Streptomyces sp. 8L TaxID=2877242 RepID=UPI001CD62277|nr:acyl-CoA desaturase [Streptomyces sp. 8L]MCA1222484.1 acyl-CoA desaturase [Streptomyces sp. 8L]
MSQAVATALEAEPERAPAPVASARTTTGSEFAPLLRQVREQGLLERRTAWYARTITVNLIVLAAVVFGLVALGPSWWALLLAPPFAVITARMAFIGHDAGHSQITADRAKGRLVQLVHANLLLGMSQEWWNDKHNKHHANPNHVDKDPDIAPDVIVFSKDHAAVRTGFAGWLTRHQAWLFFPLTTLEGIALKIHGFRAVFSRDDAHMPRARRTREAVLLTIHVVAYVTLLVTTLSLPQALVFLLIHQMLLGLHLGMSFAPNHKGMEMPDPETYETLGHLRKQVLTSRNIRGGALTDWFLGGLNYQIEHHLFPSMPRPHLRLAQPLVRAHCRSLEIPYTETGVIDSYRQALGHLHEVGEPLRADA